MEITNTIFETLLKKNNFKKKEFADYSKIPYDTVVGWKKKGYILLYFLSVHYLKKCAGILHHL